MTRPNTLIVRKGNVLAYSLLEPVNERLDGWSLEIALGILKRFGMEQTHSFIDEETGDTIVVVDSISRPVGNVPYKSDSFG